MSIFKNKLDTEYPSAALFSPDGIIVTSRAVTYLTLKSESKVNQGHCHWNPWDITRMHQMNRFGSDVVFGSDAVVLKRPTPTYLTLKSRSTVNQLTVLKIYLRYLQDSPNVLF